MLSHHPPLVFAASMQLTDFLLPAGIALLVFMLMRRAGRVRRRSTSGNSLPTTARQLASSKHAPAEANAWMVELHELARNTTAEIDTKVATLRQLLLMADEQERRLTELLEQLEHASDDPMTPKAKAAVEETRRLLSDSESQVAAMSQAGYSDVYIANQVKRPLVEIRRVLSDLRAPTSR